LTDLQKGDTIKITSESTNKLGLISEIVDDTMIRVGKHYYFIDEYEIEVLHRELT
jgi:hypothetical protein